MPRSWNVSPAATACDQCREIERVEQFVASVRRRRQGGALILGLALSLGAALPAGAEPARGPGLAEAERQRLVQRWVAALGAHQLAPPDAHRLDAEVRRHAEALRQQALDTLAQQAPGWIAPAAGAPDPEEDEALARLMQGTLAALARLQLGRHDPDRAAAWLPLLAAPHLCQQPQRVPDWSWHLQMLQQLPAAERAAAFAADLRGLAAVADPSWRPPPRPSPSMLEQLPGWLADQRAGRDDGRSLGMAPIVGHVLLGRDEPDLSAWMDRCLAAQWWAREQVHRGLADAASALLGFRYATLVQPQDWLNKPLGGTDGYPDLAQRYNVEAQVTVEWGRNALGRTTAHRIVARELKLPDAPPGAWLVWDDHFDRHALAAARSRPTVKPAADGGAAKRESATFVFKLE